METTVKDVMTTQIVAVRRGATFKEMAATLRRFRVSALPVVDENRKVIGVVSEADMLAKAALAGHCTSSSKTRASSRRRSRTAS
jgi:CBS-domain-containing membrane protein